MNFLQKHFFRLGIIAFSLVFNADASDCTAWNFSRNLSGWGQPSGITLIQESDSLLLDIYDPDSRIVARNLAIPCDRFGKLRITYRATEFSGATNGELYYATDKFPEISEQHCFRIPSLQTDGKVHELRLDVSAWRGQGTVNVLRLDLVNQAPGLVYVLKIEFEEN